MAKLKTEKTPASVSQFIAAIPDDVRRADAQAICKTMERITGEKPAMWGPSIVGFGHRKLVYPNGRELDWMVVAFSPRKAATVLYISEGYDGYGELLARLGKHKTGKACLYINKLGDVDSKVLEELIERSVRHAKSA